MINKIFLFDKYNSFKYPKIVNLNEISNISYHPCLVPLNSNINYDFWDKIYELYYESNNLDRIKYLYYLLHYINKNIKIPETFNIPYNAVYNHGTAKIYIYFDDKIIRFYSPFIKLKPETIKLPLFRKIGEINFFYLKLSQIYLKDKQLYFIYEDSIENIDPYKIFSIIDEICYYSDYYDNYFIDKMKAEFSEEPSIQLFSNEKYDFIYSLFIEIIEEAIYYYNVLYPLKYFNNIKNIFIIDFIKLHYLLQPQSSLKIEIDNHINYLLSNNNKEVKDTVDKFYPIFETFKKLPKEEFYKYFYHLDYFLFPLKKASIKTAQTNLEESYKTILEWNKLEYYTDITTYGTMNLYDFLDQYYVEKNLESYIHNVLSESAKKDWKTSSQLIYECYNNIMNNQIPIYSPQASKVENYDDNKLRSNRGYKQNIEEKKNIINKLKDFFSNL